MAPPDASPGDITMDREALTVVCETALLRAGASPRTATLLTSAALFAEDRGFRAVGVSHLVDFLDALDEGRLDGVAEPSLSYPGPAVITCDARGGVLHTGFDDAFAHIVETARRLGVAVFTQFGAYSGGQLGWFTERLAGAGLFALATATTPALLATRPGTGPVFGTNPLAFSVARETAPPLTVDQASSATAFVAVRQAAERNERIPEGWAINQNGQPTTDASDALAGALLPFGGYKGANIAWLVELLSSMAGGLWSLDAPAFNTGSGCPSVGMFVLAIDPQVVREGFARRVEDHVERLGKHGVRGPGVAGVVMPEEQITVQAHVVDKLRLRSQDLNASS